METTPAPATTTCQHAGMTATGPTKGARPMPWRAHCACGRSFVGRWPEDAREALDHHVFRA